MKLSKRNINYGLVKFKIITTFPKKKPEAIRKELNWIYVGDTTEEVKSLQTVNNLKARIGIRFNIKPNQHIEIVSVKTEKNLSKTTYEI